MDQSSRTFISKIVASVFAGLFGAPFLVIQYLTTSETWIWVAIVMFFVGGVVGIIVCEKYLPAAHDPSAQFWDDAAAALEDEDDIPSPERGG